MAFRSAAPVQLDELDAYVAFLGDGAGEGLPVHEEAYDSRAEALDFRSQIQGFEPLQLEKLDAYIPHVYGGQTPQGASRRLRPTSEWLAYDATDEQVQEFLGYHKVILQAQRTNEYLAGRFEYLKGSYVGRLHDGIREGWVSRHAANKIHRIERSTLEVGDIRSTILEWKTAQYIGPENKITIAQGVGASAGHRVQEVEENIYDSLPHEASHIFGRWLPRWASEAFAEHMNLVVRNGEPQVVNPTARSHDRSEFYVGERALLHGACYFSPAGYAAGSDAVMVFMRGATSRSADSAEWKMFEATLDQMWGTPDAFRKITARVDVHEGIVSRLHPDWNNWRVEREASILVKNELDADPGSVFGPDYEKPQPHVGAAALAGSVR